MGRSGGWSSARPGSGAYWRVSRRDAPPGEPSARPWTGWSVPSGAGRETIDAHRRSGGTAAQEALPTIQAPLSTLWAAGPRLSVTNGYTWAMTILETPSAATNGRSAGGLDRNIGL